MTNDKTALDALDRLENDALSGRDGYGDARKDAEIIRNFINTSPQPCGDAVKALDIVIEWQKGINTKAHQALDEDNRPKYEELADTQEKLRIIRAALTQPSICKDGLPKLTQENPYVTQPKADVEGLKKIIPYDKDDEKAYSNCYLANERARGYNQAIEDLTAQGYIGGGWKDISTIPDNLMSGVDLWDDREEKRHINCTFDLRAQAWADEKYDFVKIPTHWMPSPAAPKKED